MDTMTELNFLPDDTVVINKRTRAGRRANALIASATDYKATVGRVHGGHALRLTMSDETLAEVSGLIRYYLPTVRPTVGGTDGTPRPFFLFTDLVWSISQEYIVEARVLRFSLLDHDEVDVVDFGVITRFNNSYPNPPMTADFNDGNITETLNMAMALWKSDQRARQERVDAIARIQQENPLSNTEAHRVALVQKFVDDFTHEVQMDANLHYDRAVRNFRDHAVRLVARRIASYFLSVVGKTTLEVQTVLGDSWDQPKEHRLIRLDEAFGLAVLFTMREANAVDDPTRDMLGEAVAVFTNLVRSY